MIAYTNPTEQLNKINLNFPKRIFPPCRTSSSAKLATSSEN